MFALVDGNNFFASCRRVFRPELANTPVLVLNNDGCVIARSPEAKALGIRMGEAWFESATGTTPPGGRVLRESCALRGHEQSRSECAAAVSPHQEIYSIDR